LGNSLDSVAAGLDDSLAAGTASLRVLRFGVTADGDPPLSLMPFSYPLPEEAPTAFFDVPDDVAAPGTADDRVRRDRDGDVEVDPGDEP
jgi:hypothetical protein